MASILQADMATLGRWGREGWRWWLGELAGMVPARLRLAPRALLVAPGENGGWVRLGREGAALSARERGQATIALPPTDVQLLTIDAPPLGPAETRQMIAFDLDRLTPFPPGTAIFDYEKLPRGDADRDRVLIGVMPEERARARLDQAERDGVRPVRMAMIAADGTPHFDFLPMLREAKASGSATRWWVAVAALFLANVAMLVWRDMAAVEALRAAVEEQAPAANTAKMLERRIVQEDRRRARIAVQRVRQDPLRLLDMLGAALPAGVYVQRLTWEGDALRLAGYAPEGVDVQDLLLGGPLVRDIQANDMEAVAQASGTGQPVPFDINVVLDLAGNRP